MNERLYHVSEQPNIAHFEPRPPPSAGSGQEGTMVWAVNERLLHNYLLPRNCPRVTFYALPSSSPADMAQLLAGTSAGFVVAIETYWWPALRDARLYVYELPPTSFMTIDPGAGYSISREGVTPLGVEEIADVPAALLARDVELRMMPSLWKLHDAVAASSLQFSIIRMRNAQPRPAAA